MIADLVMALRRRAAHRAGGSRIGDQRPGEGDALSLTAGNFRRLAPGQMPTRISLRMAAERCRRVFAGNLARPYSTFCSTVRCGKSAISWNTKPTDRCEGVRLIFPAASKSVCASSTIRPGSGVARPAMQLSSVVFPEPERPNRIVKPGAR